MTGPDVTVNTNELSLLLLGRLGLSSNSDITTDNTTNTIKSSPISQVNLTVYHASPSTYIVYYHTSHQSSLVTQVTSTSYVSLAQAPHGTTLPHALTVGTLHDPATSAWNMDIAIPDEYLLKFHNVADAKSLWEEIKSRFRDKAYDRIQKLISQLEVHGAPILKEDINQKFLRSLPPSWNQIALIMRNKPDIDEIDIDDLYNNLRVYEDEMKRSSSSTSTSQNLSFLSSKNTSSTNEVSTASGDFRVSTAGGINQVLSTLCAHDVACSFFAQPTTNPQLENEDFLQIDEDDLEELDLRWQVAMLTVRVRKFIQKTGRNMDFKEK
ncbi:hypothetical protein Tco_1103339 [Tanacetum coccineum]